MMVRLLIRKAQDVGIETGKAVTGDDHWWERLDRSSQRAYTFNVLAGALALALIALVAVVVVIENVYTPVKVGLVRTIPVALFVAAVICLVGIVVNTLVWMAQTVRRVYLEQQRATKSQRE